MKNPLEALREFLDSWGAKLCEEQEDGDSGIKEAVLMLKEHIKGQEPKAVKQARLQSTMAQLQARKTKLKQARGQVQYFQEQLCQVEKQVDDLETDIARLEIEEKELCSEVQEAEDLPTPPSGEADTGGHDKEQMHQKGDITPKSGQDLGQVPAMLARLTELMSVQVKQRKRARNMGTRESSPDGGDSLDSRDAAMGF
jgi:chromosome segregation ATPase